MKTVYQIICIALIAALAGLGTNLFREDSILVFCRGKAASGAATPEYDPLQISLVQAQELYLEDRAVFIDARPESAYRTCHITGALNVPWQQAEEECFMICQKIPVDKTIITYCDGPSCELSDFMASFLLDLGYMNARSLHNGLSRWREAGLPTTSFKG